MSKKNIIIILCVCIAVVFLGTIFVLHENTPSKHALLLINGSEITDCEVTVHEGHSEIPLLPVISQLDCQIERAEDSIARIVVQGQVFYLDLDEHTLYAEDNSMNLLTAPPGNQNYACYRDEDDLVVDSNTLKSALRLMGVEVNISEDYVNATVAITIS